jgi:DNA-binding transcriptional LysR family regulator
LVSALFREVRQRFPAVRLQINEGFGGLLDEAVANGSVDIAVLNRYGTAPPENEELLARTEMLLIGPPGDPVTRKATVLFKELHLLALLLPSAPNAWRTILERVARRQGVKLNEVMVVDSVSLLTDAVMGGGCYAIVPAYCVAEDVAAGRLQASRIVKPVMSRMLTLCTTSQRPITLATREVGRLVQSMLPRMIDKVL